MVVMMSFITAKTKSLWFLLQKQHTDVTHSPLGTRTPTAVGIDRNAYLGKLTCHKGKRRRNVTA